MGHVIIDYVIPGDCTRHCTTRDSDKFQSLLVVILTQQTEGVFAELQRIPEVAKFLLQFSPLEF